MEVGRRVGRGFLRHVVVVVVVSYVCCCSIIIIVVVLVLTSIVSYFLFNEKFKLKIFEQKIVTGFKRISVI